MVFASSFDATFCGHDLLLVRLHETGGLASATVLETARVDGEGFGHPGIFGQGLGSNFLGRSKILFHQKRRDRQDITDGVESESGVVGWEIFVRVKSHPDDIRNGVLVFLAIHAPDRHAARIGIVGVQLEDLLFNPREDCFPLFHVGLELFLRRRHEVCPDIFPNPQPSQTVFEEGFGALVFIEDKVTFLCPVSVTIKAVVLQQRFNFFREFNLQFLRDFIISPAVSDRGND